MPNVTKSHSPLHSSPWDENIYVGQAGPSPDYVGTFWQILTCRRYLSRVLKDHRDPILERFPPMDHKD